MRALSPFFTTNLKKVGHKKQGVATQKNKGVGKIAPNTEGGHQQRPTELFSSFCPLLGHTYCL